MTPTRCASCRHEFDRRPILQAEAHHVASQEGDAAAEQLINDALADYHEDNHA